MSSLALQLLLLLTAPGAPALSGHEGALVVPVQAALDRLRMPSAGKWVANSDYEEFRPPREIWERSVVHMRSTAGMWVASDAWEREWVRERAYITKATWIPAVAQHWNVAPEHVLKSESLVRCGASSRFVSRERSAAEDDWRISTTLVQGDDLLYWGGESDSAKQVRRHRLNMDRGRYSGALFAVAGVLEAGASSLSAVSAAGEAVADERSLSWSLDLTRPKNVALLNEYDLPGGLAESPGGRLHGEYQQGEGGTALALDWLDPRGARVARQAVRWDAAGLLSYVDCETFAPGTEFVTRRWSVRLARTRAEVDDAECRWRPQVGDYVIDDRFGASISYRVEKSGLPSDDTLRERAGKAAARVAPTAGVVHATLKCASGAKHGPGAPEALGTVSIDLATRAAGQVVPVEVELVNHGDAEIELGPLSADCGCVVPQLLGRTIPAGGSVVLRARQTVERVGAQVSHLSAPILRGGEGEVRVTIRYVGVADPARAPGQERK